MISYKDYDEETAREVVMDWFQRQGIEYFTPGDVAYILAEFEEAVDKIYSSDGIQELEEFLKTR